MTTLVAALLGLAALLAAALSAMTGVGGGVLLLSGLLLVVPATAVVPLHGAVQTAAGLTRIAAFWRHVRWEIVGRFVLLLLPGSLVGILIVGWLASVSPTLLEVLLAVAILASLFAKRVPSPIQSATSAAMGACPLFAIAFASARPISRAVAKRSSGSRESAFIAMSASSGGTSRAYAPGCSGASRTTASTVSPGLSLR